MDEALVNLVRPYTKTGDARIAAMIAAVRRIDELEIPGDIVECGVWKAGNIILARKLSPKRVCWLFDTFSGMTEPDANDLHRDGWQAKHKIGWCEASVDEVEGILASAGVLHARYTRFIIGAVERTLKIAQNIPDQIALLRLDTDWYASTRIELEALYPRLVKGGHLIVDDYGHWQGARKAVDEYFGDGFQHRQIDYSAIEIIKP